MALPSESDFTGLIDEPQLALHDSQYTALAPLVESMRCAVKAVEMKDATTPFLGVDSTAAQDLWSAILDAGLFGETGDDAIKNALRASASKFNEPFVKSVTTLFDDVGKEQTWMLKAMMGQSKKSVGRQSCRRTSLSRTASQHYSPSLIVL